MKKIAIFELRSGDRPTVCHQIITDSGVKGACSSRSGKYVMIQTEEENIKLLQKATSLAFEGTVDVDLPTENIIKLSCLYVTEVKGDKAARFVSKEDALRKFCTLLGVVPAQPIHYTAYEASVCAPLKMEQTSHFSILNRFEIAGDFAVTDRTKFEKGIFEGIGRRRSYGYGMIMASAVEDVESDRIELAKVLWEKSAKKVS